MQKLQYKSVNMCAYLCWVVSADLARLTVDVVMLHCFLSLV